MKILLTVLALVLLTAVDAAAQTQPCISTDTPQGVVFGRSLLTFTSVDHSAVDPAGALKVGDYFAEVRVKNDAAVVTNFTIPKSSVTPVSGAGVPAGCLQTLLPAMGGGLLPSATYTLFFFARNPAGVRSETAVTADFFLSQASVPISPANLRLVTP